MIAPALPAKKGSFSSFTQMMTGALTTMCWDNTPPRQSLTKTTPFRKKKKQKGAHRGSSAPPARAYLLPPEPPAFPKPALLASSTTTPASWLSTSRRSFQESGVFFFLPLFLSAPCVLQHGATAPDISRILPRWQRVLGGERRGKGGGSEPLRCSGNFHLISPKGNYVK